jgi:deoxyadenosine/deoxycytidine kinase
MAPLIAVEGLIGAGKTTLCHLLARERGARMVLEPSERNPFLVPFYRDPGRYAFPAQMAWLIERWRQQVDLRQLRLFDGWVVMDYVFAKDRLFAEKVLAFDELELYLRFSDALGEGGAVPDLLVVLDAPPAVCLERIRRRAAPGEDAVDQAYLEDLAERYHRLVEGWTACPVVRIDASRVDVASDLVDRAAVLTRIDAALAGYVASDVDDTHPALFPPGS